jgi:glycosyltransferase involved in cell wall biosynthesis
VITAFNDAEFIEQALRSVKSQVLQPGEIIVVDDGSSDASPLLAEAAGARLIRHDRNRGLAAARNSGIRASQFDWIAFLDADDEWREDKLLAQWTLIEANPQLRMVFCDREHFTKDQVVVERHLANWKPYLDVRKEPLPGGGLMCPRDQMGVALIRGHFIKPSTLMVRKDLFEEAGMFDEGLGTPEEPNGTCEDLELNLRLVRLSDAGVVEAPLLRYRMREGSMSGNEFRMLRGSILVADMMEAKPERYALGAPEAYRLERPGRLREAGVLLMHKGDFPEARRLLWRSLREEFDLRTFAALGTSLAGPRAHHVLVGLKRKLGLRGLN